MFRFLSRLLIRFSARLAARDLRGRWREEWLAEIDAAPHNAATLRRALGAPRDAWSTRASQESQATSSAWTTSALGADGRQAWRQLLRRPGHTGAVVACLAVGLVASTGTFSVLNSFMFGDQIGIRQRAGLARVYLSYDSATSIETIGGGQRAAAEPLSLSDYEMLRDLPQQSALDTLAAEGTLTMTAVGARAPISVTGAFASGNFFQTLRTSPSQGRLLVPSDDVANAAPVAVVTDYFWRTQLDARADAIGKPILLAGQSFTLIGVTPPRFHGMRALGVGEDDSSSTQVWVPLTYASRWPEAPSRNEVWLQSVGRLRDGHTRPEAQEQLSVGAVNIAAANPRSRAHATAVIRAQGFGPNDAPIELLLIIAAVLSLPLTVLAIGCANVANLQLARAAERSRELAVRLSLGATRGQLTRLLTFETLATTIAAVLVSLGALAVIIRFIQPWFPTLLVVDWRVMSFSICLTGGIALATGLVPAWLVLRGSAAGQMKQNAQGGGLGHQRLRSSLIVIQVALSLVLLSVAAIFLRTIKSMELSAPAALRQQLVSTFNPAELRMSPLASRQFADALARRASADPRVTGVALSTTGGVRVGKPGDDVSLDKFAAMVEMTPSWLDVMDVTLLTGRALTTSDTDVALVSARMAHLLAPGGSPLGQALRIDDGGGTPRRVEVVGVVADNPLRPTVQAPDPVVYTALPQTLRSGFTLRLRSATPEALETELRAIVTAIDPRMTWTSVERGERRYLSDGGDMVPVAAAIGACGVVALLLSATGLYAVISYIVALRRQEIGIRLAVGADPRQIIALVLRQAMFLVIVGTVLGLALGIPVALGMRATFVVRVDALDPVAFAPTVLLLLVTGVLAAAIPARRAAKVNPVVALRQD